MDAQTYPNLSAISDPTQLQQMSETKLKALAEEARTFLIESINKTGGHLGAALGVVELTLALFHHFDFLQDRIAWDVGHQGHVYKLLSGRANRFSRYGQWGGMCKFLERNESPYDHMGAGHASTSASAALGMALARDLHQEKHHVMAVIGDGAMTGGLAYEALHMIGTLKLNLLVILNDNGMSIDHNIGLYSRAITRITTSHSYNKLRQEIKRFGKKAPFGDELLKSLEHVERSVKDYASGQASWFESMGLHYFGPVDGHNLPALVELLGHIKQISGPVLLHLHTVKGKGLGKEVENTFASHAVASKSAQVTPAKASDTPSTKSWTHIYSQGLWEIMKEDPQVVAITAAMQSNTGLAKIAEKYPQRVLDMGIAEANVYCSAAGMSIGGVKPFVTVYSTFTQRAFDQLIHDIALQNLPVRIMLDRGGLVGADGPTHHGVFDFSYLRLIPNFVHMAPCHELEMRRMMLTAHRHQQGPIAMRYARGETPVMKLPHKLTPIPIGQGELLQEGALGGMLLVGIGSTVNIALQVAQQLKHFKIPCAVINARFLKPLDENLLLTQAQRAGAVVTIEENTIQGGFGEAVLALLARHQLLRPQRILGVPDRFIPFGSLQQQLQAAGLTPEQVTDSARQLWQQIHSAPQHRASSSREG